mmetsp:Transcript_23720/g.64342  ORF Transcript_23720/g.64342 Transcript_23720/m.64342 type:complete len:205 (+) Transcript_23720:256-870(+)
MRCDDADGRVGHWARHLGEVRAPQGREQRADDAAHEGLAARCGRPSAKRRGCPGARLCSDIAACEAECGHCGGARPHRPALPLVAAVRDGLPRRCDQLSLHGRAPPGQVVLVGGACDHWAQRSCVGLRALGVVHGPEAHAARLHAQEPAPVLGPGRRGALGNIHEREAGAVEEEAPRRGAEGAVVHKLACSAARLLQVAIKVDH